MTSMERGSDAEDVAEDLDTRPPPRRSYRARKPPVRYPALELQQSVTSIPVPRPRSVISQKTVPVPIQRKRLIQKTNTHETPIPAPRLRNRIPETSTEFDRKNLLNVFVGMQESQQRVQEMVLDLLTN